MNALTSATLLATTSISTPAGGDAELIRMCDAHAARLAAANDDGPDNDAADLAYRASVDFINDTKATTLAGLLAKARAAKAEAAAFYSDSDEEHWQNGPAENWAPDVCNELLALFGSAAPSPDAELLEACAAFDNLERAYIAVPRDFWPDTPEQRAALAEQDRIVTAQKPLVDRICALRTVTREGQAARVRSLILWEGDDPTGNVDTGQVNERLLGAILRDLVGGSAVA